MADNEEGGWWASRDGDWYSVGPEASREAVIRAGIVDFDGDAFHIVEAYLVPIQFSAAELIDVQYFENDDLFHMDGGEPDRRGDSKAADAELQALLDGWLAKHSKTFASPTVFAWSRNEELIPAGAVADADLPY